MSEPNPSPPLDDCEVRICAVFGLRSGSPLPHRNDASDQTYYDYLKAHLQFPFAAELVGESVIPVTVVGMAEELPIDECFGAMCQVRDGEDLREVAVDRTGNREGRS